jgi:hypothetical protein
MNRPPRRRRIAIPAVLAVGLLQACVTLHNEPRFSMAKEASAAFDAAKITDALKDERTQNQAIFDRELQVVEREMRSTRDAELRAVLEQPNAQLAVDQLRGYVEDRRRSLGAGVAKAVIAVRNAEKALDLSIRIYESRAGDDDPKFKCGAKLPTLNENLTSRWNSAQADCDALAKVRKTFDDAVKSGSGEIVATTQERDRMAKEKDDADQAVQTLTNEFKKESADLKARKVPPTDFAELAKSFKKKLDDAKLPDSAKASKFGIDRVQATAALAWLDETRTHVDKLLDAAQSGSSVVPPGVSDDLQIASVFPSIAEELHEGFHYPRVSALVLESEHIRLERDRQKKILERLDEKEQLVEAKLLLAIREQEILAAASGALKTLDAAECSSAALTEHSSVIDTPPKCAGPIVNALVNYSVSWAVGRIPAEKIEWAEMNLDYSRSLDDSEGALAQWQNLIHVPLQALVTSYEGGIKPDQIARLINDIELGVIAVGVQ